ncbi:ABC transporter permease [Luteibaculum oceani]|uniref:Iron ABC transporter permease n=1 Tax=Luteibaculum oceani TaxID=1294296 RepID=A0A5C6VA64_9FLAO|nr:iron ABC transporter permease [Luteibaculum oceani]TXC81654.1 iron ABC transporter permease [Luteibaculum oceani]
MLGNPTFRIKKLIAIIAGGILVIPLAFLVYRGILGWSFLGEINSSIYLATTKLVVLTLFLACLLAVVNGVFLFYFQGKHKQLLFLLLLLPLAFPTYIMAFNYAVIWEFLSYLFGVSRSGIKSIYGLSLVCSLCLYPYILLPFHMFLQKRGKAWFAQAEVMGVSQGKLWISVVLPCSAGAILLGASLVGYELLNDYGAAKYYGVNTLTTQIFKSWFGRNQLNEAMGIALLLLVIILALRYVVSVFKTEEGKTSKTQVLYTPKLRVAVSIFLSFFFWFTLLAALLLPVFAMGYGLYFDWNLQDWSILFSAGLNSVVVALLNALFTVLIVAIIAEMEVFSSSKYLKANHKILASGYAIPGAVIAVAVIGFGTGVFKLIAEVDFELAKWLNQSLILLLLALVFKLYAVAVPSVQVGWETFGKSQVAAIKVFQRFSSINLFGRVVQPQMLKFYAGAALFVFIDTLKELPITLLLRPFNFETLAVKAYNLVEDEFLYRAAPYSLIICLFCALGIYLFNRINRTLD